MNTCEKGFTLIELLVVVAIIGILASVGTVAYQNYTKISKRNNGCLCMANGGGTLALNSSRSINCDIENNASGINQLNEIFINYFLDQGWRNPFDPFYTKLILLEE